MLEDLIKVLKKKITILTVVCVFLALACVGLIVFVTCEYEVVYEEYEETIDYEITQDIGNGSGDNVAIIGSDVNSGTNDETSVICGAVIASVLIVVIGVIIYGKTKNKSKKKSGAPSDSDKA